MAIIAVTQIVHNGKTIPHGTKLQKGDIPDSALKKLLATGAITKVEDPSPVADSTDSTEDNKE